MLYSVSARYEKKIKHFDFMAFSDENAKSLAVHAVVNYLRNKNGMTGEIWRYGKISVENMNGFFCELEVPPHLTLVE
jgi:hypothetical protein